MKKMVAYFFILALLGLLSGCVSLSPLTSASFTGDIKAVKNLLDQGADVNKKDALGWSPLMWAAASGRTEIVTLLIDRGADIDAASHGCEQASDNYGAGYITKGRTTCVALLAKIKAGRDQAQSVKDQSILVGTAQSKDVVPMIKSDIDDLPTIKTRPNKNA